MQGQNLPLQPPDLVTRDQVIGYPTDFSPMPEEISRPPDRPRRPAHAASSSSITAQGSR